MTFSTDTSHRSSAFSFTLTSNSFQSNDHMSFLTLSSSHWSSSLLGLPALPLLQILQILSFFFYYNCVYFYILLTGYWSLFFPSQIMGNISSCSPWKTQSWPQDRADGENQSAAVWLPLFQTRQYSLIASYHTHPSDFMGLFHICRTSWLSSASHSQSKFIPSLFTTHPHPQDRRKLVLVHQ